MAAWFLRGLRRGVVTTRYPAGRTARRTTCPPRRGSASAR